MTKTKRGRKKFWLTIWGFNFLQLRSIKKFYGRINTGPLSKILWNIKEFRKIIKFFFVLQFFLFFSKNSINVKNKEGNMNKIVQASENFKDILKFCTYRIFLLITEYFWFLKKIMKDLYNFGLVGLPYKSRYNLPNSSRFSL